MTPLFCSQVIPGVPFAEGVAVEIQEVRQLHTAAQQRLEFVEYSYMSA
jgi:hypothetical protein